MCECNQQTYNDSTGAMVLLVSTWNEVLHKCLQCFILLLGVCDHLNAMPSTCTYIVYKCNMKYNHVQKQDVFDNRIIAYAMYDATGWHACLGMIQRMTG